MTNTSVPHAAQYRHHGPPPWPCAYQYCDDLVHGLGWGVGLVHHRNEDRTDNSAENVCAMHIGCHIKHHRKGKPGNRLGIPHTEKVRQQISATMKTVSNAQLHTPEVRARIEASIAQSYKLECECGMITRGGAMKKHTTATQHAVKRRVPYEEWSKL